MEGTYNPESALATMQRVQNPVTFCTFGFSGPEFSCICRKDCTRRSKFLTHALLNVHTRISFNFLDLFTAMRHDVYIAQINSSVSIGGVSQTMIITKTLVKNNSLFTKSPNHNSSDSRGSPFSDFLRISDWFSSILASAGLLLDWKVFKWSRFKSSNRSWMTPLLLGTDVKIVPTKTLRPNSLWQITLQQPKSSILKPSKRYLSSVSNIVVFVWRP